MKLNVGGNAVEVADGTTVAQLVVDQKVENPDYVTVAVNDAFVDHDQFASHVLSDGDTVEFLYFMGGGR